MTAVATSLGQIVGPSGTSVTLTTSTDVPAGSLIIIGVGDFRTGTTSPSVTDSAGNTYTFNSIVASPANSSANGFAFLFYCWNCTALPSGGTITYTNTFASGACDISAAFVTGIPSTGGDPSTGHATNFGTGTTATVSLGTRPAPFEIAFGWAFTHSPGQPISQASGWNTPLVGNSTFLMLGGNQQNTGTAGPTYAPALNASAAWCALMVSFKTVQSSFISMPTVIP